MAISDISETIKHIRSVKSDYEIDLVRRAAENLDTAIAFVVDHLREDMRETNWAAEVEKSLRLPGLPGSVAFRRFNTAFPWAVSWLGRSPLIPAMYPRPQAERACPCSCPRARDSLASGEPAGSDGLCRML